MVAKVLLVGEDDERVLPLRRLLDLLVVLRVIRVDH